MNFDEREAAYLPILARAFAAKGLPPEWGPAIARQESGFIPDIENQGPGDAERGGSYGLCQMSLRTARSLGYDGPVTGLKDPQVNASLAADLCADLMASFGPRLEDVAAGYNSGKPYAKAPRVTQMQYVPNVLKYAALYQERCATFAVCSTLPS